MKYNPDRLLFVRHEKSRIVSESITGHDHFPHFFILVLRNEFVKQVEVDVFIENFNDEIFLILQIVLVTFNQSSQFLGVCTLQFRLRTNHVLKLLPDHSRHFKKFSVQWKYDDKFGPSSPLNDLPAHPN